MNELFIFWLRSARWASRGVEGARFSNAQAAKTSARARFSSTQAAPEGENIDNG